MYSAVGSESAFRDGVFSQAAPAQGYQHSVREYADGSLGVLNDAAYRDGSPGDWRNSAAYHDGSLGATTRLLRPPRTHAPRVAWAAAYGGAEQPADCGAAA